MNRKEYWKKHYDALYHRCLYCSPGLKPIIEYIKERADISDNERKRLYQEYENGSTSAKKRLIEYYMRTALQIAYLTSRKTGVALDELFSIALEEMILIIERFNNPKGEKYLYLYIRNNIQRSLNVYAEKLSKHVSLDEISGLGYEIENYVMDKLSNEILCEFIRESICDFESTIIMMHVGFMGYKYTFEEIAEELHTTERRVNYNYKKGLEKLKKSEQIGSLYQTANSSAGTCPEDKKVETTLKLQYGSREFDIEEIRKAVEADCKAKKYAPITELEIYIKPEDNAVYYVVNHENADKIGL